MKIAARGLTDAGRKRDHNEDSFCVNEALGLFVVADGMGGHAGGGTASQLAVQSIEERIHAARVEDPGLFAATTEITEILDGSKMRTALSEAVREACRRIHQKAQDDPSLMGMGTTVTAMEVTGRSAFIAHVGDSRCYLVRKGHIYQLTEDHSLVNEQLKTGAITAHEARYSRFRNIITRSVGFEEDVQIDAVGLPLEPEDQLVLCSDGLSNLVPDDEILETILKATLDEAPGRLIDLANARGGDDNITVIVVGAEPDQSSEEAPKKVSSLGEEVSS